MNEKKLNQLKLSPSHFYIKLPDKTFHQIYNLRHKNFFNIIEKNKPEIITPDLKLIIEQNLLPFEQVVYYKPNIFHIEVYKSDDDFKNIEQFNDVFKKTLLIPQYQKGILYNKYKQNCMLYEFRKNESFLPLILAKNIDNKENLKKIINNFGKLCGIIAKESFIYPSNLAKYSVIKTGKEEFEIYPINLNIPKSEHYSDFSKPFYEIMKQLNIANSSYFKYFRTSLKYN